MDPAHSGTRPRASAALLAAVAMLSAAGLTFEITLTRLFSATIWYHYTFVAISVALFGWGLGGFLVYVFQLSKTPDRAASALVGLSLLTALALPLFPFAILQFPFAPERLNLYFLLSSLPFLAGGATLSLAFEKCKRDVTRLYFVDLVGAAAGTLLAPLAISLVAAETAVLATAALPSMAAVLLASSLPGRRRAVWTSAAAAVLVGVVALVAWNLRTQALAIRDAPGKALYKLLRDRPQAAVESDRWNAYSRITCVTGFDDFHLARIFIDSDAETSVQQWDGLADGLSEGRGWFRAFPFRLAKGPSVLVIGPGGGTDVVLSIVAGSPSVTAVEMNPLIVDCVRQLGAQAGNLYDHPNVDLVIDEGRNFIQRSERRFDLIVLGFVDSWASVASGGLSLSENYLYTREAIESYYDHLTDQGALVVIRWPEDVPRLVANSVDFLLDRGMPIADIAQQLIAVAERKAPRTEPVETVFMLTRSPVTQTTVDRLLEGHPNADVIHAPWRQSQTPYADLFAGNIAFREYTDAFQTMATPVRDDRPFYFARDKPRGIPDFVVRLFKIPVIAVIGFTVVLFVSARLLGFRAPGPRTATYFTALGLGFIMCEMALMQRLILLLGHPIYTLVVILFTLLLAGGLGSLFARRFPPRDIRRALKWILLLVFILNVLAAFALSTVVRAAIPLTLSLRIPVAGLLVFPFGFLMGMPFPLGLRKTTHLPNTPPVSALWGINGVASVAGSIAAMVLALVAGFTWVFLASALCYAIAWTARP